jgi:hypothetical protein
VLRVNLADGQTLLLDLDNPSDFQRWRELRETQADQIRGIIFVQHKTNFALAMPKRFEQLHIDVKPVAHRDGSGRLVADSIMLHADDVVLEYLIYRGKRPRTARVTLEKLGRPVYIPNGGSP